MFDGLDAAQDAGFSRIKLNAVILEEPQSRRDHVIWWHSRSGVASISVLSKRCLWAWSVITTAPIITTSSDEIREDLGALHPGADRRKHRWPSRYFRVPGVETRIGFISPHQPQFLRRTCNRVRLTSGWSPSVVSGPGAQRGSASGGARQSRRRRRRSSVRSLHRWTSSRVDTISICEAPVIFAMNHTGG